jgi:hypothetical protein
VGKGPAIEKVGLGEEGKKQKWEENSLFPLLLHPLRPFLLPVKLNRVKFLWSLLHHEYLYFLMLKYWIKRNLAEN